MKWDIVKLANTASTNADAMKAAANGAAEGTVIVAAAQSAGRGRQGRQWVSQPGAGLYISIVLRPPCDILRASTLPLAAGLAVAEALDPLLPSAGSPFPVAIKWPNDLHVGGRKLCGILCELSSDAAGVRHVVAGIGVNVNLDVPTLPPDVAAIATSLKAEAGHAFQLDDVLTRILASFGEVYGEWLGQGFPALLPRIARRDTLLGKRVSIELVGTPACGVAAGIAASGALLLRKDDGSIEEVFSGEAHVKGVANATSVSGKPA